MDTHTLASIVVGVFTLMCGVIGFLVIQAVFRRLNNGETDLRAAAERLRVDELATEKLNGRVQLVEQARAVLERDVQRMQEDHVPRAEWERAMQTLTNSIERLASKIDRLPLPPSSGQYQQVTPPDQKR